MVRVDGRGRSGVQEVEADLLRQVHWSAETSTVPPQLTKARARAFRDRRRRVDAREVEDLRTTDLETRWRQFNTLLARARRPEWAAALSEGVDEVRERWTRLRKAYRG